MVRSVRKFTISSASARHVFAKASVNPNFNSKIKKRETVFLQAQAPSHVGVYVAVCDI